jgi:hypothetical protein
MDAVEKTNGSGHLQSELTTAICAEIKLGPLVSSIAKASNVLLF